MARSNANGGVLSVLVVPGLALTAYWTATHGLAGLIAGVLITTFLVFGAAGIVTGGPLGGAGAAFLWFIAFVIFVGGMFLVERVFSSNGATKKYGPGGEFLADRVMGVIGGGLSTVFSAIAAPSKWLNSGAIAVCLIGVIVCGAIVVLARR